MSESGGLNRGQCGINDKNNNFLIACHKNERIAGRVVHVVEIKMLISPAGIYLFKVDSENLRIMGVIYSK